MDWKDWANRHPVAATELFAVLSEPLYVPDDRLKPGTEAGAQQSARIDIASQGAFAFRNNVGATPSKCVRCGSRQRPVRYGLANDSHQMNNRIKSSDLILMIPRLITPDMVGTYIAQFGAVETKRESWKPSNSSQRELAQAAFITFVESKGGFGRFSRGKVNLGLH